MVALLNYVERRCTIAGITEHITPDMICLVFCIMFVDIY